MAAQLPLIVFQLINGVASVLQGMALYLPAGGLCGAALMLIFPKLRNIRLNGRQRKESQLPDHLSATSYQLMILPADSSCT